jgi:hypothetical protein
LHFPSLPHSLLYSCPPSFTVWCHFRPLFWWKVNRWLAITVGRQITELLAWIARMIIRGWCTCKARMSYLVLGTQFCIAGTRSKSPISGVPRGRRTGFGGFKTPQQFRSFDKAEPNSQFRGKYIRNSVIIIIRVPLVCKLSGTTD